VKNASVVRTTSVFDAANQLQTSTDATDTFDASGNQQIVVAPTGSRTTYVWNYENQNTLVQQLSGTRETMAYNADFRRVTKWS